MHILSIMGTSYNKRDAELSLIEQSLAQAAIETSRIDWHTPIADWPTADAVFFQPCAGYHTEHALFMEFLDKLDKAQIPAINSTKLIRWNANKTYLQDLQAHGCSIAPTLWCEHNALESTIDSAHKKGWSELVIKPTISAGAYHTMRLKEGQAMPELPQNAPQSWMVQPFLPEIIEQGEWSLLFFGGTFSHACLKTAKEGDYRIQHTHGGHYQALTPPAHILTAAQQALTHLPEAPTYARIDGIDRNNTLMLMEIELIEPFLYLSTAPIFAKFLARSIQQRVHNCN